MNFNFLHVIQFCMFTNYSSYKNLQQNCVLLVKINKRTEITFVKYTVVSICINVIAEIVNIIY